ncbi:ammonia-dependent NAD(+) synthetase [Brevibacillus laterosporus]|uniref:ammonia-dependent NAD(+) synthetase n=1 Tax=Brevibacillus laterosporus TaxID=1465 RepID=UPI00036957E7|nr:ammonia-dependent NAD(+) synthetase [Brevibacillus laterosporus]ATO51466.1 NAD(+) synthase [Brevibacillus laterosporus DSM 25]MBG9801282.1 NAD synthetase [Brevibacillus laterosporus]MCR8939600.1 ammonia-dependent NAD(+) synthetase [Brevibacillus laterosporus]MCZ0842240.1 ammonia-dependent NAD(+) synthetase [Brevibacillus laterosporus]MCZ0846183.1 ammonia-dependent NAD(+) synthetase [Brevibacillus laterosporus]
MTKQAEIIRKLHVHINTQPEREFRNRVDFLKKYLLTSAANGYIIGISGGIDSTLTGIMARVACDELTQETSKQYHFVAVRLPYGTQVDEDDAQSALQFIKPHKNLLVNIKPAVDTSLEQLKRSTGYELSDFLKGNTKARERMKVQYDIAGHLGLLVLGTDQAVEATTGFFTKYGDGGTDVVPLSGLTKGQVRQILQYLGAPDFLYLKIPTADLEDERPQLPDETALGFSYDALDNYLTLQPVPAEIAKKIEVKYDETEHKRHLPVTPFDDWWQ